MLDPATLSMLAGGGDAVGSLIGSILGSGDKRRALNEIRNAQTQVGQLGPEDEELRKRQMQALQQMMEMAQAGGMDPQSRAALQQAQAQNAAAERGARGAIQQNAQARGVGGSGVEFMASLGNQQGAATRNSMAGTQAAGDARSRALQALSTGSSMAGQNRGQDLNYSQARSAIDQFNAEQRRRKAEALAGIYSGNAQQKASTGGGIGSAAASVGGYLYGK